MDLRWTLVPQIRNPRKCCFSRTAGRIVEELCAKVAHYAIERARKNVPTKNISFLRKSTFCAQKLHASEREMLFLENCRNDRTGIVRKSCTLCHRAISELFFSVQCYNFEKINFLCQMWLIWTHVTSWTTKLRLLVLARLLKNADQNVRHCLHTIPSITILQKTYQPMVYCRYLELS